MWKPIKDWEDLYMVNEFGDVKNIVTGNTIVGDDNGSGYKRVKLWRNKQSEMKYRHRLVAETFIPNPNNLPEVNHIDSNRSNNHIDNLEWVSRKQNKRHSQIYGNEKSCCGRTAFQSEPASFRQRLQQDLWYRT